LTPCATGENTVRLENQTPGGISSFVDIPTEFLEGQIIAAGGKHGILRNWVLKGTKTPPLLSSPDKIKK